MFYKLVMWHPFWDEYPSGLFLRFTVCIQCNTHVTKNGREVAMVWQMECLYPLFLRPASIASLRLSFFHLHRKIQGWRSITLNVSSHWVFYILCRQAPSRSGNFVYVEALYLCPTAANRLHQPQTRPHADYYSRPVNTSILWSSLPCRHAKYPGTTPDRGSKILWDFFSIVTMVDPNPTSSSCCF